MKKLVVKGLRQMVYPENFVNTIYQNFIYLANNPNLQHNKREIQRLLTDENMIGYIVCDDKHVVAYLIGEIKNLNDGRIVFYISYIFVAPKYRVQKIGSYLLRKVIVDAQNKGLKFVLLTCDVFNEKLFNFYRKFGFRQDPLLKNDQQHDVLVIYL